MDFISELVTIISGLSTLAIAVLTIFLWRENRMLREAGNKPHLVANFEVHPDGTGGINIAISNTGKGPARDIYFEFSDHDELDKYDILFDHRIKRGPVTLLPQGDKLSFLFAISFRLFQPKNLTEKKAIEPFYVSLEWKSLDGRKSYQEKYLLDIKPYEDLPGLLNKPPLLKIANAIEKLEKQVRELKPEIRNLSRTIDVTTMKDTYRQTKDVDDKRSWRKKVLDNLSRATGFMKR